MIAVFFVVLSACSLQSNPSPHPSTKQDIPKDKIVNSKQWKWPLAVPVGEYFTSSGWLSDDKVVYITNQAQSSFVYAYNLFTGKSELLYKSEQPIVTAEISPAKNFLLIHTAPSTYQGKVTIIDRKGKVQWKGEIPSYELSFEWNPYDESQILVTAFNEDWSYRIYLVDLQEESSRIFEASQPFLKWLNEKEIGYLNFDNDRPSLFAPLVLQSLSGDVKQTALQKVYQFNAFKNSVLMITVEDEDRSRAFYTFYDKMLKKQSAFSMPLLSRYSDWLIPYYDYSQATGQFFSLQPVTSGEADTYKGGFNLVAHRIQTNRSTVLLKGLSNEPISCSPSGKACLYGASYDKLIDTVAKKVITWVKQ